MDNEKLLTFKSEYFEAKSEFSKTVDEIVGKLSYQLESILPIIDFLKSENILFTHPELNEATYKGAILGKTSNGLLLVYCGENAIKTVDTHSDEFGKFDISYNTFVEKYNLDYCVSGIRHINRFEQELTERTNYLKQTILNGLIN